MRYPAGRSSGRPGQPRNRGDGGQPFGLITERDERMKCLYVTASPAESECLTSCGIRAGHHAHYTQITDRIIGGHAARRWSSGSPRWGGLNMPQRRLRCAYDGLSCRRTG